MQIDEVRYKEDLPKIGFNYVKLGLSDVLLDIKNSTVYTPNTNQCVKFGTQALQNSVKGGIIEEGEGEQRHNPYHDPLTGRFTSGGVDKSGGSGIIEVEKGKEEMQTKDVFEHLAAGNRRSPFYILTEDDIKAVELEIEAIKAEKDSFIFNSEVVRGTCFLARDGKIHIKGNIFPDEYSDHPRDKMSIRAVLAHEYYGHRPYRNQYLLEDSLVSLEERSKLASLMWADEFRASYMAAKNAPGLTAEDRRYLILDSLSRAKEAGVSIKYNKFIIKIRCPPPLRRRVPFSLSVGDIIPH